MITHEEINEIIKDINVETNYAYKYQIKRLVGYVIQQQTNEELLKLYKDFINSLKIKVVEKDSYQYNEYVGKEEYLKYSNDFLLSYEKEDIELFKKIQKLESELKL